MSHETSLTKEEQQMEVLLGQFQPMAAAQCRDKLMFRAGRASAGHARRWQGISGVFAVLLLCSLMIRTVPSKLEPKTVVPQLASTQWQEPQEATALRPMHAQAYINVRHRVLEQGLDALLETKGSNAVVIERMGRGDVLKKYMAL
jgi:hypothetical protein